jgi:hypothetical protein
VHESNLSHELLKYQNSSKSYLFPEPENTPIYKVTSCLQNDTTNVDFAYIESE